MKSVMNFFLLLSCLTIVPGLKTKAQDVYRDQRSAWLQKAESSTPVLNESIKQPVSLVTLIKTKMFSSIGKR
jgi:hypothetical protein